MFWFEALVAQALLAAGADDIRIGLKWAWPKGATPRDEVDVLARIGHRFLAVSCKVGRQPSLAKACREIEAAALQNMGRFAIPMLVRPWVEPSLQQDSLRAKNGAVVLDIAAIAEPSSLRQMLDTLFRQRSTRWD